MNPEPRKPLAKVTPQTRDERLTVRLTTDERDDWRGAAERYGEEMSRYSRRGARIGRNLLEAQTLAKAAGA